MSWFSDIGDAVGGFMDSSAGWLVPPMKLGWESLGGSSGIGGLLGGGSQMQPPPGMSADDFMRIAYQQDALNNQNQQYTTQLNRPQQVTPFGTTSWARTPGDTTGLNWTQTTSLPPALQAAFDQQNMQRIQRGGLSSNVLRDTSYQLAQPLGVLPPLRGLPSGVNLQTGVNLDAPQQQGGGGMFDLNSLLSYFGGQQQAPQQQPQAQPQAQPSVSPEAQQQYQQQLAAYQQAMTAYNQPLAAPTAPAKNPSNEPWVQPFGANGPYATTRNTVYVPGVGEFGPKIPDWLFWENGALHNKNATDPSKPWRPPAGYTGSGGTKFTPFAAGQSNRGPAPVAPTPPTPTAPAQQQQQAPQQPQFDINALLGLLGGGGQQQSQLRQPSWEDPAALRMRAEDAIYQRTSSRLDPQWNGRREQMRTELYNQGLRPGSEAYDRAMQEFERARQDAYQTANTEAIMGGGTEAQRQFGMDIGARQQRVGELFQQGQFANQSALQGYGVEESLNELRMREREQMRQEELQRRLQGINEMNALLTGQQVGMPGAPAFQPASPTPGANLVGAYTSGTQAQLGAQGMQQAQQNAMLGGLAQLLPMLALL